uniref:NASS n=1 Tax=Azotobacter vinelandii TaxID=354 RepID=Q44530_AZOVI|nr:NASS [Azotobacter vinelandii]
MTDHHATFQSGCPGLGRGSDAPEKSSINLGFMPLTDSASLIVAATQGFAEPYGLTLNLKRQVSWSGLRDKLLSGELDAAQGLYGLIYSMQLGIGGAPATDMAVLMGLNQNGQSINLSTPLRQARVCSGETLVRHVRQSSANVTLAQTFPTGTHALWLYYWLASLGIHPLADVNTLVVPPPQMVEHLRAGRSTVSAPESPAGPRIDQGMGFTIATSQSIWPDHPEKSSAAPCFAEQYPNTARALIMAVLNEPLIDASEENKAGTAQLISANGYVAAPRQVIEPRFLGDYEDGNGMPGADSMPCAFMGDGEVNLPYLSDGLWFMTQFRRWGLLREDPDYLAIATRVQQLELYRDAAGALGMAHRHGHAHATLLDGRRWDGSDPRPMPAASTSTP